MTHPVFSSLKGMLIPFGVLVGEVLLALIVVLVRDLTFPFCGVLMYSPFIFVIALGLLLVLWRLLDNPRRRRRIALGIALILPLPLLVWAVFGTDQRVIARLDCGNRREIVILEDLFVDEVKNIYYRVRNGSTEAGEMCLIGIQRTRMDGMESSLEFDIVKSRNGYLIGVIEKRKPDVLLVIHDFETGWSSPRDDPPYDTSPKLGGTLLDRLRLEYADRKMRLGSRVTPEILGLDLKDQESK